MTDLDIIYKYYKDRKKQFLLNEFPKTDEQGNLYTIQEEMFGFLIDYYHKNGFPNILKDSDYDALDKKEVYRGVKDYEHAGNMLCHFNYHYGRGIVQGMYFSRFKEEALAYTRTNSKDVVDEDKVLKAKILSGNYMGLNKLLEIRRGCISDLERYIEPKYVQKKKELFDFLKKLREAGDEDANEFYNIMKRPGVLAVYLELDYLIREGAKHVIVFNRNALAVKESDFKKICERTEHYKDGHFDFYNVTYGNNEK